MRLRRKNRDSVRTKESRREFRLHQRDRHLIAVTRGWGSDREDRAQEELSPTLSTSDVLHPTSAGRIGQDTTVTNERITHATIECVHRADGRIAVCEAKSFVSNLAMADYAVQATYRTRTRIVLYKLLLYTIVAVQPNDLPNEWKPTKTGYSRLVRETPRQEPWQGGSPGEISECRSYQRGSFVRKALHKRF